MFDASVASSFDASLFAAHPAGCSCPICTGRAQVDSAPPPSTPALDSDPNGAQSYLNADARLGTEANGKPSYSIDQAANQIVRGEPGWSSGLGVPFTVSYAYRASEPASYPEDTGGFQRFNAAQINEAELAIKAWSDVANIRFVRVGFGNSGEGAYSDNAAILLGDYTSGMAGASAFAIYPGSTGAGSQAGDVWINSSMGYNSSPAVGNYGGHVLVHELGHAIGLAHPADYNAAEGVTITYTADAIYYEDSRQYTVMSYFSEGATGGNYGGIYAAAPQLDDIAAAQLEYGPNMATRTGDTVYGFNSNADRPWFITNSSFNKLVFAVWDAGGNDTFDFSGYFNDQLIDLRSGFFSNVGGLVGNVAVAQGVAIENARGGGGSDVIHGNALANNISGGAGNDTISGGEGANRLRGEEGADVLQGGSGFDDINGNAGADVARGGAGDDWVVGGKDDDWLHGGAGGDIVLGNLGADTVDGGDGADQVRGGQGNDVVTGGAGADYVSGDRGDDTISGEAGADLFHGSQDAGIDRVTDFNPWEGDRVMLDPGTSYALSQVGGDTVISMGGANQMVLVGVQLSGLTPGWIFEA